MRRSFAPAIVLIAVLTLFGLVAGAARAGDEDETLLRKAQILPLDLPNITSVPDRAGQNGSGVGPGQQGRQSFYCGAAGEAGRGVFDKDISCDSPIAPDNEMAIVADPADPNLLLGGSNDYQLNFMGNTVNVQVPSGWFLSQDGGGTWIDGSLPLKGSLGGGDPAPGFDTKRNRAVFASLSFVCGQGAPVCSRGNVLFASADLSKLTGSQNDTLQWSDQTIANGSASDNGAQQLFLDKEWIAVDNYATLPNGQPNPNYGNYYVTFQQFRTEKGRYDESPVMFVMSRDGGQRWTLPVEISGRNPDYCTFQDDANDPDTSANGGNSSQATSEGPDDPNACDQDSFSYPAVAPDGTLYVQFDNEQNMQAYEPPQRYDSQVLLVKSKDGGRTFQGETPTTANQQGCVRVAQQAAGTPSGNFGNPCIVPTHIVNKEDSYDFQDHGSGTPFPDYPINVDGRTTLTGHQFRVNSAGTIAIGKTPAGVAGVGYRVWTVWDDNCHGVRPGPGDVQEDGGFGGATTNIDVYYAFSDDGGATWTGGDQGPVSCVSPMANAGHQVDDQFFPWAAADPTTGNLAVGYMDEDPTTTTPHTPDEYVFSVQTVSPSGVVSPATTVASAPSRPNESLFFDAGEGDCMFCATFIGDYNGLDVGTDGKIHSVWTDMRRSLVSTDPTTAVQDAFYARIPPPTP